MNARISSFRINGTDLQGFVGDATVSTFSTDRSDGISDTDVDDEYITLTFNAKQSVTQLKFETYGELVEVADLAGNKLADQTIGTVE